MIYNINDFDYKHAKLILANPQKQKIGLIGGVKELKIKLYFNSISEMTFKIYKEENGKTNPLYNKLTNDGRLILVKGLAWFQIKKVEEKQDANSKARYKEVSCLTLENELIYRRVTNINGVFNLYDVSDTEHSLLHIVQSESNWNVGHIDQNLLLKWRTLSIDSDKIYNLLTTTISQSYECVFLFDTFNRTINAYELSNLGSPTNIVISDRNILQSFTKDGDLDNVVTKLRARGGTNADGTSFDFRAVNPTGMDYLIDLSYYMDEHISQETRNAWNAYKAKEESYYTQYSSTIAIYKTQLAELTTLNTQLTDIESEIKSQQDVIGVSVKSHNGATPISTDTDYAIYQEAITKLASYTTQKVNKQAEISAKENQIATTRSSLNSISVDLSPSANFTLEQLEEINCFTKEGDDYTDETYCVSETMTAEEALELKIEFMNVVKKELAKVSKPQFTIKTSISNLYMIQDGLDQRVSYDKWKEQFTVGNIITLKIRDDVTLQVRLMSVEIDTDNLEDIEVTFSDKSRLDDELVQLAEIIAQADRTSTSLSLAKMGYDIAAKQTSDFMEFKNGVLNATYNQMVSDGKAQVMTDEYGIHIRQWLEDATEYSPYQMWLNPYRMLFSNDGFKSANSAFGLLVSPTGEKVMGINTDLIIGNMMLTENLSINNPSNTITMNKDGAKFVNCGITINRGNNVLTLDAIDGIKLTKSGTNQFWLDSSGNLNLSGKLTASDINGGNIYGTYIEGSQINGGVIEGSTFTSTNTSYTMKLTSGEISFTDNAQTGDKLIINHLNIGWVRGDSLLSTVLKPSEISSPLIRTSAISITGTNTFPITIPSGGRVTINDYDIITSNNYRTFISIPTSTSTLNASLYSSETYQGTYYLSFQNTYGDENIPTIGWVKARSDSDERLKENFNSLDIEEKYMKLEPIEYTFKDGVNNNFVHFGFKAQTVAESFDPKIYDIVEFDTEIITRGEQKYVTDGVYRLNDKNMHAMHVHMIQKLYNKIIELENKIT